MPFRAFIAIDISSTKELLAFHAALESVGKGLKTVGEGSTHVTLKFLGEVNEDAVRSIEECMKAASIDVKRFEVTVKGAGVFPSRSKARVVWTGMEGAEPMGLMAARLEDCLEPLGFPKEGREFRPHLTLARVKDPRMSSAAAQVADDFKDTEFGRQIVSELLLKKSVLSQKGPSYSTVLSVPLA
ncbi:MAG: RNA 2',3'-cyclic phosphodiesterase [Methanomassiliicoccales archaeon]|nr:RNA 2',3'-cyclic phosphodiesterase [Methanomassiliicoccales archaeon]